MNRRQFLRNVASVAASTAIPAPLLALAPVAVTEAAIGLDLASGPERVALHVITNPGGVGHEFKHRFLSAEEARELEGGELFRMLCDLSFYGEAYYEPLEMKVINPVNSNRLVVQKISRRSR